MDESEEVCLLLEELGFSDIDIYHLLTRLKTLNVKFRFLARFKGIILEIVRFCSSSAAGAKFHLFFIYSVSQIIILLGHLNLPKKLSNCEKNSYAFF